MDPVVGSVGPDDGGAVGGAVGSDNGGANNDSDSGVSTSDRSAGPKAFPELYDLKISTYPGGINAFANLMPKRKGEPPTPLFSAPMSGLLPLPLPPGEVFTLRVFRKPEKAIVDIILLFPNGGEVPLETRQVTLPFLNFREVSPAGLEAPVEVDVVVVSVEDDVVHAFIPFII